MSFMEKCTSRTSNLGEFPDDSVEGRHGVEMRRDQRATDLVANGRPLDSGVQRKMWMGVFHQTIM